MSAAPSGAQHELRLGDQRAVVAEVGAALRLYSVGGRDVVVPFGESEIAPAFHGAVLLPWPNRLRDGKYAFDGVTYQVPITEPDRQVALHGLVCWERWSVVERAMFRVTSQLRLVPTPGYPFALCSQITHELKADGLEVTVTTTNVGDNDAPYGIGFHPWLSPGKGSLDECILSLDADSWVRLDDRMLPIGQESVPAALDFREPRLLAKTSLDDTFVDATFTNDRSWLRLTGTDGRTAATWMEKSLTCWQVCTGDAIGVPNYARSGLAAEPMTCIADAFRTGERLTRLEPGAAHTVRWGLCLLPA